MRNEVEEPRAQSFLALCSARTETEVDIGACNAGMEVRPFLRRHAARHADDGFCCHDSSHPDSESIISNVYIPSKFG